MNQRISQCLYTATGDYICNKISENFYNTSLNTSQSNVNSTTTNTLHFTNITGVYDKVINNNNDDISMGKISIQLNSVPDKNGIIGSVYSIIDKQKNLILNVLSTSDPNTFIFIDIIENEKIIASVSGKFGNYIIKLSNGYTFLQRLKWRSGQGKKEIIDGSFYTSCFDCQVPAYDGNPDVLNCKCYRNDKSINNLASSYLPFAREHNNLKNISNDNGNLQY